MATIKKAFIDSINLKGNALDLFNNLKDFEVTQLLSADRGIKNTHRYKSLSSNFFNKNQREVYEIYHSPTSQSFIIQSYHNSYNSYFIDHVEHRIHDFTITFAGLHGYTNRSSNLLEILLSISNNLIGFMITRIDVCTDFKIVPTRLLKKLDADTNRQKVIFKNTTYYNQKSKSVTIAYYDKQLKEGLDFKCLRVEYRFNGSYLNNKFYWTNDGLKALYKRLESYIFKAFNEQIKIQKVLLVSSLPYDNSLFNPLIIPKAHD